MESLNDNGCSERTRGQQIFDFDMASLLNCISNLSPRPVQNLFRALLLTLATQPKDACIDESGFVIFAATYKTLAANGGRSTRQLRRYCREVQETHRLVRSPSTTNTAAEFHFQLTDILPRDAVRWFVELVECGSLENVSLTKQKCQPDKTTNVSLTKQKCQPDICPDMADAHYRAIAIKLAKLAVAGAVDFSDGWATARFPDEILENAEAVELLFQIAVGCGVIVDTPTDRLGVFCLAVMASTRSGIDWPAAVFRRYIAEGWHLTTRLSKPERLAGKALLRRADGGRIEDPTPDLDSDRAWSLLCGGLNRFSLLHQPDELRESLPPEVLEAGRAVGLAKIGDRTTYTTSAIKREFSAAFDRMCAVHKAVNT